MFATAVELTKSILPFWAKAQHRDLLLPESPNLIPRMAVERDGKRLTGSRLHQSSICGEGWRKRKSMSLSTRTTSNENIRTDNKSSGHQQKRLRATSPVFEKQLRYNTRKSKPVHNLNGQLVAKHTPKPVVVPHWSVVKVANSRTKHPVAPKIVHPTCRCSQLLYHDYDANEADMCRIEEYMRSLRNLRKKSDLLKQPGQVEVTQQQQRSKDDWIRILEIGYASLEHAFQEARVNRNTAITVSARKKTLRSTKLREAQKEDLTGSAAKGTRSTIDIHEAVPQSLLARMVPSSTVSKLWNISHNTAAFQRMVSRSRKRQSCTACRRRIELNTDFSQVPAEFLLNVVYSGWLHERSNRGPLIRYYQKNPELTGWKTPSPTNFERFVKKHK